MLIVFAHLGGWVEPATHRYFIISATGPLIAAAQIS